MPAAIAHPAGDTKTEVARVEALRRYCGTLECGRSPELGGARISIRFPESAGV